MFAVNQIQNDLEEVLGTCDTSIWFQRLDAALDLLQPMLPTDSNIGILDLCSQNCIVTLPEFVEVPLAINISGHPANFRDKWYEHHQNGPGSQCCNENCTFGWGNTGLHPTFRDLIKPSKLVAYSDGNEGSTIPSIYIYGEDVNGKPLYSDQGDGCKKPGLILPITSGSFSMSPAADIPLIKRITQVVKPATCDFVRLYALDSGRDEGTLIGYYRPDEKVPAYRRIMLSGQCDERGSSSCNTNFNASEDCCDPEKIKTTWVRMRYQRRQQLITTVNDVLFVPSREAIIQAVDAVRQYRSNNYAEGDAAIARARGALEEKQNSLEGPGNFQAQYPNDGVYGGDGIINMI